MAQIGDIVLEKPIGIGTLQWGTTPIDERMISGGRISEQVAADVMAILTDGGVSFFDTAEGYGGGTSELRLGRLRGPDAVIATKFLPTPWRWTHGSFESALRGSLERLGQTCCDVYFLHSPVHPRPIEFWVEAAAKCKEKGLLKTMGLSNCDADQVKRAVAAGKRYGVQISCNQIMFSLLDYNSTKLQEVVKTCHDLKVTIIGFSPICQGLFTDKLTPERFKANRTAKMIRLEWDQLVDIRAKLKQIADKYDKSMAQVAINWCICHNVVPLVGCRSAKQAKDTLGSLGWKLDSKDVQALDKLALDKSTLDSPLWRRAIVTCVFSGLMIAYKLVLLFS
mmetsp:Transcript_5780/g.8985  ORF Transcript_5780/g.8985 Transcript_5780/m.8985 type:complete len:337 (-) Transcript_5780:1415-2425(-)